MHLRRITIHRSTFKEEKPVTQKTNSSKTTSQNAAPWRGVHLIVGNNAQMDALAGEIPALAALGINVLMTEINYSYAYVSHPEVRTINPITEDRVRTLVKVCREHNVRLIPQFQCLGHQSWSTNTFPLLIAYPQFDETPGQFPNNENIYCRSW